jgi:hypothetical protein
MDEQMVVYPYSEYYTAAKKALSIESCYNMDAP